MTHPPVSVKSEPNERALLRHQMLAKRREIDDTNRKKWDEEICEHLLSWLNEENKHLSNMNLSNINLSNISVYSAIFGEPNLDKAYQILHTLGAQLSLPITIKKGLPLQFASWSPSDEMTKDKFGIPIPANLHFVLPDISLIPCVGFNDKNYRLGYGGGFYDRTLAQHPRPIAIGIAYQNLLVDFTAERFDIPMDILITEKGVFKLTT